MSGESETSYGITAEQEGANDWFRLRDVGAAISECRF
jgi:hypothetical protein